MILKIKLDKRPLTGDGLMHDEYSPVIICIENKNFPICEFKFQDVQTSIDTKLFVPGMAYQKVFNILIENAPLEFDLEKNTEFVIQK